MPTTPTTTSPAQSVTAPSTGARASSPMHRVRRRDGGLRFARDHDLEIAIRGGGHNVAGTRSPTTGSSSTSCNAGRASHPADRRAWVQGGAPGATSTTRRRCTVWPPPANGGYTGVAGLTSAVARRRCQDGLTVDNPSRCSPRDGRGEVLRASGRSTRPVPGVARRRELRRGHLFEFCLHPSDPSFPPGPSSGMRPMSRSPLLQSRLRPRCPDELGTVVRFGAVPPLPAIPENLHWRLW